MSRRIEVAPWGDGASREFTIAAAVHWARHIGRYLHPTIGVDEWSLHPVGTPTRLPVAPPARKAIYIAVDSDDDALYVGRVHRTSCAALSERFRNHHAIPCHAASLWVLPCTDDCPLIIIDRFERQMIGAYQPPYNIQHCRQTRASVGTSGCR